MIALCALAMKDMLLAYTSLRTLFVCVEVTVIGCHVKLKILAQLFSSECILSIVIVLLVLDISFLL